MAEQTVFLDGGLVTSPKGFVAGATFVGMKTPGREKMDLGILMSERPATTVGTFTTNKLKSGSVVLTEQHVSGGKVRAVVASSGIANACVGEQGYIDAKTMVELTAKRLGLQPSEVAICTTGIIGVELPIGLIRAGLPKVQLVQNEATLGHTARGGYLFSRAIMTTDRRPKSGAMRVHVNGTDVTIGGCVKGSGMIHPNMATMLAFLTTDANVEPGFLRSALKAVVDDTFNMVTVDGDSSTNDTVLLMANGAAGNRPVEAGTPAAEAFQAALYEMCTFLVKEIVRDAEGSEKIFGVRVEGAKSKQNARLMARAIAGSMLVKSAIHGNDPNWGRIVAAAGRSGADIEESKIDLLINDVVIMEAGRPIVFFKDAVISLMNQPELELTLRLRLGDGEAVAWGCELSEEYVHFNSAYTT